MLADNTLPEFDSLPEDILDIPAEQLYTIVPGPTIFRLSGKRSEALFVSVMLHGNEPAVFKVGRWAVAAGVVCYAFNVDPKRTGHQAGLFMLFDGAPVVFAFVAGFFVHLKKGFAISSSDFIMVSFLGYSIPNPCFTARTSGGLF